MNQQLMVNPHASEAEPLYHQDADMVNLTGVRALLVDDQPEILASLISFLKNEGAVVEVTKRAADALKILPVFQPQIVFLDVMMPHMNGLDALVKIKSRNPDIIAFMLTGHECIKDAVQAIKAGADNYFTKPYHLEEVKFALLRALEKKRLEEEVAILGRRLEEKFGFDSIITKDQKMLEIFERLRRIAPSDLSVLITGENGTGKELIAQAIHYNSHRIGGPFVPVDCAAIPDTLFESEVFGHEKGAFTGSINKKMGLFEMAHRGTLFLDEIGNLKPENQSKLLRAIQENKILPLGAKDYKEVDIRLITATNADLDAAKKAGAFREDIYFRINQFHIHLPPLRERPNDILLLARHFLSEEAKAKGKIDKVQQLSQEVIDVLTTYSWPGNVRELKNIIRSASVLADHVILPEHLTLPMVSVDGSKKGIRFYIDIPPQSSLKDMHNEALSQAERYYIERMLIESNYRKKLASEWLKISPKLLSQKIKAYNIGQDIEGEDVDSEFPELTLRPGMTLTDLHKKIGYEVERLLIIKAIKDANGNKAEAARVFGIDYKTLHSKISEYEIHEEALANTLIPETIIGISLQEPIAPLKSVLSKIRDKMEESLILHSLKHTNGDKAKAARVLGIDYKTLYNKLHKYSLMSGGSGLEL